MLVAMIQCQATAVTRPPNIILRQSVLVYPAMPDQILPSLARSTLPTTEPSPQNTTVSRPRAESRLRSVALPSLWSLHTHYHTALQWLSLMFTLVFVVYLLTITGLMQKALESDRTYISIGILLTLLCASIYCGFRALWLSGQHAGLQQITDNPSLPASRSQWLSADYLACGQNQNREDQPLVDVFIDRARSGNEILWFIAGVMIKAGLVGTVIGFVQMLASVSALESFDISQMQEVLRNMSSGMGVALYTTLVGIAGSVALGVQVLLLDRSADRLVANTVRLASDRVR